MHTSDQINAATIADTPRQGGTFRNFSVNHTEFRCGTKEQHDTPRQGDVSHTEFRCGSKSSTAAKNIGGDESAGMILRPKQNHRHSSQLSKVVISDLPKLNDSTLLNASQHARSTHHKNNRTTQQSRGRIMRMDHPNKRRKTKNTAVVNSTDGETTDKKCKLI